jgi:hypothetical protein
MFFVYFLAGCHRVLLDALAPSTSSRSSGRMPRFKTARRSSSLIDEESDQKYLFNVTYNSRLMEIS